ncbi:MAG: histidinol-phosphatase HisJ family protein [Chloroflexota bacterium]|nr:histidinol-phosphatase HisJ family protein [Chloroflexota bacterium]
MLADYHTHHFRCGHATGQMDDYVEAAIAAGLDEIGLSDHAPIYHFEGDPHPRPQGAMSQTELPAYIEDMQRVRDRFAGRIGVRLGVESDYVLGWDDHYRRLWQQYPLDYVIGSVHWLEHWSIFDPVLPPNRDAAQVYAEYLYTTQAAARSGVYDIIGHLDCLKTAGHIPDLSITPLLEETVRVLAASGVAIELNTSGWRKPFNDCFPRAELLACCCHYGVPVTLGSDAHTPDDVAYRFADAIALLQDVGYREFATFASRKRRMVPLQPR